MFSGCTVPPNSNETEFGSSHQEDSPSAGKSSGIVLMPCCAWKCVPTAIFSSVHISEVHGCHEFSVRVTKLLQGFVSHRLAAYFSIF